MSVLSFILWRVAAAVPTLLIVLTLAFLLLRLAPGDPVTALLGDFNASPAVIAAMREHYGLDQPVVTQYALYVWHALRGDFGVSMRTDQDVLLEILKAFPYTLMLAVAAIVFAVLIGLPLGALSAIRPNTWLDHVTRLFALFGICAPSFALALVLMLIFSVYLDWLPLIGVGEPDDPKSLITHLILPALALALRDAATIARLTRALMLSVLREDYVTTARAKGLSEVSVVFKHAFKNTLVGILTVVSLEFAHTLGGAVVIETMFGRPGLGSLIVQAITSRDYPQLQGTVLFFAFCVITINLLTDLLYRAIDPRIEFAPAAA